MNYTIFVLCTIVFFVLFINTIECNDLGLACCKRMVTIEGDQFVFTKATHDVVHSPEIMQKSEAICKLPHDSFACKIFELSLMTEQFMRYIADKQVQ